MTIVQAGGWVLFSASVGLKYSKCPYGLDQWLHGLGCVQRGHFQGASDSPGFSKLFLGGELRVCDTSSS